MLEASLDPRPVVTLRPNAQIPSGDYGLFGSVALPMGTLPATKQWRSVSATDFTTQYGAHCQTAACGRGVDAMLTRAALKAEGQPALEALTLINSSVNRLIRYRADAGDHWATPVETAARGAGDCEDFAIAKLWLLRSIGYTPDQLQLVILRDTRTSVFHAVLAVHVNGERYILDNLSNRVLTDGMLKAYVPIESFAGDKTFIHGFDGGPTTNPNLAARIQRLMDREVTIEHDAGRDRPAGSEVERLLSDNTLARELLRWEPRHSLDEGLELTIEWLGRHLDRYRPGTYQV